MHHHFASHRQIAQSHYSANQETQPMPQKKSTVPVPPQDPVWNDVVARTTSLLFYYIWFIGPLPHLSPVLKHGLATPPASPRPCNNGPSVELFQQTLVNARHFQKFIANLITSLTLNPTVVMAGLYYVCKFRHVVYGTPSQDAPHKFLDLHQHCQQVSFEYRLICICLMLANKMWGEDGIAERKNDQWSEVSGIPIPELTTLEQQILSNRGFSFALCLDRQNYSTWLSRVYHEFLPSIYNLPNAFPGQTSSGLHEYEMRDALESLAKHGAAGRSGKNAALPWEDAKKVIKRQWAICIKWNSLEESLGFLADRERQDVLAPKPVMVTQWSSSAFYEHDVYG